MTTIYKQYNRLTESEKNYLAKSPHHAMSINDSKNAAFEETKNRFGKNDHNDKSDAFRHCFWSAMLSRDIGYFGAIAFTTAHEEFPDNPPKEKEMDLHNNKVGASIGMLKKNNEGLAKHCFIALQAERLKVIGDSL